MKKYTWVAWDAALLLFSSGYLAYELHAQRWPWAMMWAALTAVNAWALNRDIGRVRSAGGGALTPYPPKPDEVSVILSKGYEPVETPSDDVPEWLARHQVDCSICRGAEENGPVNGD